jgi:hypothetical protein
MILIESGKNEFILIHIYKIKRTPDMDIELSINFLGILYMEYNNGKNKIIRKRKERLLSIKM